MKLDHSASKQVSSKCLGSDNNAVLECIEHEVRERLSDGQVLVSFGQKPFPPYIAPEKEGPACKDSSHQGEAMCLKHHI